MVKMKATRRRFGKRTQRKQRRGRRRKHPPNQPSDPGMATNEFRLLF